MRFRSAGCRSAGVLGVSSVVGVFVRGVVVGVRERRERLSELFDVQMAVVRAAAGPVAGTDTAAEHSFIAQEILDRDGESRHLFEPLDRPRVPHRLQRHVLTNAPEPIP